tara:strand:+ start:2898 stop:3773 length:876 start_codon:yes stop_codon:yes gene_type:complete
MSFLDNCPLLNLLDTGSDLKTIQKCLKINPKSIYDKKDIISESVLHVAARYCNRLDILQFLINLCPELLYETNLIDDLPIHIAIINNNSQCVKMFLHKMDKSKIKHNFNKTLLHTASEWGSLSIFDFVFNFNPEAIYCLDKNDASPFISALYNGNHDGLFLFQKIKKLVNQRVASKLKFKGNLPLHQIVEYLCKEGSNDDTSMSFRIVQYIYNMCPRAIKEINSVGDTPLDLANKRLDKKKKQNNCKWFRFLKIKSEKHKSKIPSLVCLAYSAVPESQYPKLNSILPFLSL